MKIVIALLFTIVSFPSFAGTLKSDCEDQKSLGLLLKKNSKGNLLRKCQPDTLYSWGPLNKVENIKRAWEESNGTGPVRSIYTTRSSVATYGYGTHSIRFKLKKGIKFDLKEEGDVACEFLPEKERLNSIFVRTFGSYRKWGPANRIKTGEEYIICDLNIIESWSYGTSTHLEEMNNEIKVLKSAPLSEIFLYAITEEGQWAVCAEGDNWNKTFYFNDERSELCKLDKQTNFSTMRLEQNLQVMQSMVDRGEGEIFARKNKDLRRHFQTRVPTYFSIRMHKKNI